MAEALSPGRAWELIQRGGAVVLDLRPPADFAQAHPPGAINLPYSQKHLADRLRAVLEEETPIVLLASGEAEGEGAVAQLRGEPFPLRGVLDGGLPAWQSTGLPTASLSMLSIREVMHLRLGADCVILDVREPMEWEMGHVPGATLLSLGRLRHQLQRLPKKARIAVICESGARSSTAASLLQNRGFSQVANVLEGTGGYRRAGLPLRYPDSLGPEE